MQLFGHFCISLALSLSSTLPLFTLSFSFMLHPFFPLSPLSSATGLLAVCHHLKEHQVPLSGRLHIAKHRGMETVQTLFHSHTHICARTCTFEGQPNMNKSVIQPKQTRQPEYRTNLASALPCRSTALLTSWGNCWGHRKPIAKHRFSRCINDPWPREEHFIVPHPEPMPRPRHGQPSAGGRWSRDMSSQGLQGLHPHRVHSETTSRDTSGWAQTPVLALRFRSKTSTEAVLYERGKNESNSKGGMWLYYNITEIMCVVLWS